MNIEKQNFAKWLQTKNLKEKTIDCYCYYFDKFDYTNVSQKSVNDFLERYNNIVARAFMKNFLHYIKVNHEEISLDSYTLGIIKDIELPKRTGKQRIRIPKTITEKEVKLIEDCLSNQRDKLMLLISFYGGLRVGGLMGIRPFDFNFKELDNDLTQMGELFVTEKGDKEGIAILPNWLIMDTRKWINEHAWDKIKENKPIFDMSSRNWRKILAKASYKALGYKINPHVLRHSIATHLVKKGVDTLYIKEFLRHSSIVSTQIYLHLHKKELKDKYANVFELTDNVKVKGQEDNIKETLLTE